MVVAFPGRVQGELPKSLARWVFWWQPQNLLSFSQEAELERLEREFAIQSQITEAARRLASDPNVSKKLKKQRKTSYLNALKKLQEIENAINEYRIKSGKKPTQRASLIIDGKSQHPQHHQRLDFLFEARISLPSSSPSVFWRAPGVLAVGLSLPIALCSQMFGFPDAQR